jgi:hypothetical protein
VAAVRRPGGLGGLGGLLGGLLGGGSGGGWAARWVVALGSGGTQSRGLGAGSGNDGVPGVSGLATQPGVAAPQQIPATANLLAGPEIEEHSHAVLRADRGGQGWMVRSIPGNNR